MRKPEPIEPGAEERARRVLAWTFYGIHHVPYWHLRRAWGDGVKVSLHINPATFDYSYLTRLVIAAHDECMRVQIMPGGRGLLSLGLTPRMREGETYDRHPTLDDAIARERAKSHA